ncbi:SH3 domain-containing protein [Phototrophicus methaneseepsis]|uniref:SH3 domain-containing protein n=1 Tax=Phototrophicus methaneseepsis TaxID=2710758 RepID=A0A7S8ECS2_9CHLR|nr:SH3 domain-containing protein [Phototrophicus methaneseepsis]QPC84587.1 SH3 domain-containing protein [Phototrophicus methaneseepsis]
MKSIVTIMLMLCLLVTHTTAQETGEGAQNADNPYAVWVTTQDYSSLRRGPGTGFERMTIIDPTVTLPAIGRSADTRWIQVINSDGSPGWIASILLVWSGDVIALPVDGVNPEPYVRRAGAVGVTSRETPYYRDEISEQTFVGTIPVGTTVELVGRLGDATFGFWQFQIKYQDNLYWIGSWNVRITGGEYLRLLDTQYLYPYGRLVQQYEENIALVTGSFQQIRSIWQRLNNGATVACDPIPPRVNRILTEGDVTREVAFVPAVTALDEAIRMTNLTISSFETICADTSRFLTREDIDEALGLLNEAERNLLLAASLLEPLRGRNPLVNAIGNN